MLLGSTSETQCICASGTYGWYKLSEAGDGLVFSCELCPVGFFCDGVLQEPQGCGGNSFCGDDDEFMYMNGECVPIPPGQGPVRRRRTLVDEVSLTMRNTTGIGSVAAIDCRCIRGYFKISSFGAAVGGSAIIC